MLGGPAICRAPQLIAEELLLGEGFTEIEYIKPGRVLGASAIAQGLADIGVWDIQSTLPVLDAGDQVVVLAGIHVGCWELFGNSRIDSLRDLKGKTVAIRAFGLGDHVLLSCMLAYIGMDSRTAINWVAGPLVTDAMPLFVDGKADAFVGFPRSHRSCVRRKSGTSSSTRHRTDRGRNTTAAWRSPGGNSCMRTPWLRSAFFGHF